MQDWKMQDQNWGKVTRWKMQDWKMEERKMQDLQLARKMQH